MDLFTLQNLSTLVMLTLLQAVLGFDNLLYVSMESKRVEASRQRYVRTMGVGIAIFLRVLLLIVLLHAMDAFREPFLTFEGFFAKGALSGHALIVILGGGFIIYTAIKEIYHMLGPANVGGSGGKPQRSVPSAITWIVLMNLVFSFDSILSAIALTKNVPVMTIAIVISGVLMIWLADRVAAFLQRNRMYEVLGLFILLLVGVMLLSEGGHLARLEFFGHAIEPMTKSTFYFVLVVLVLVDVVQGRYQRKVLAEGSLARDEQGSEAGPKG